MGEEAALQARLQAKDTALKALTRRYLAFANAVETSSAEECEALHDALQLECAQYEFAVSKANALIDTNVRQVAEYDAMQQRVQAEMESTRADIERLRKVLEEERTKRQQKEQYSVLARRIHALPSRADTQDEISRLNEEITGLKRQSDEVAGALEQRAKKFAAFTHALHDIQMLLAEEGDAPAPS